MIRLYPLFLHSAIQQCISHWKCAFQIRLIIVIAIASLCMALSFSLGIKSEFGLVISITNVGGRRLDCPKEW